MTENLEERYQNNEQVSRGDKPVPREVESDTYPSVFQRTEPEEKNREITSEGSNIEDKLGEFFKGFAEEATQLNKALIEEKRMINELCNLLAQILGSVGTSVDIPTQRMTRIGNAKQIRVSSEGQIMVICEDGVESELKFYSTEMILEILWAIFPEIVKAIRNHKDKVIKRVTLLGKIRNELTNLRRNLPKVNEKTSEGNQSTPNKNAQLMEEH
jgi:hypothetical protein